MLENALGQLLAYHVYFTDKLLRVHFFGNIPEMNTRIKIISIFALHNIAVTWEQTNVAIQILPQEPVQYNRIYRSFCDADKKNINIPENNTEDKNDESDISTEEDSIEDDVNTFIHDMIIKTNSTKDRIKSKELYNIYCKWCDKSGITKTNHKKFSVKLVEEGFKKLKSDGIMVFHSIKLTKQKKQN